MIQATAALRIAIIGARDASPEGLEFAYEIGKLLGQRGAIVYTGGAQGIMEAASKGAFESGGTVVGILKENDLSGANEYIHVPIMTGMGDLRNGIIIRSVQGAIAVEGAYGTLSEIAYTLSDKKPVLGFHSWDIPGLESVESPEKALNRMLELIRDNQDAD